MTLELRNGNLGCDGLVRLPYQTRTTLGASASEGTRLLRLFKVRRRLAINRLAQMIGAPSSTVTRWIWGDCTPDLRWAQRIGEVTNIAPSAWTREPKSPIEIALHPLGVARKRKA